MKNAFYKFCFAAFVALLFSTASFAQNIIKPAQFTKETNDKGVQVFNVNRKVLKTGKNVLKTNDGQFSFTFKKNVISDFKFTASNGVISVFKPPVKGNAFNCNENACGCYDPKDCQNMIVFSGMKFKSCNCVSTYDEKGEILTKVCGCITQ